MSQQTINIGTVADDGTGDTLRAGGIKINENFTELYADVATRLVKASNLSDLTNVATARTNLGLGSAAVLAASAVLLVASNLSDLASVATARTNLGLGTLATQSGTFSGTSSGTNTGDQTISLTGDVTGSGTGSFAATIAASAVTLAKMANIATASFIGRTTGGTGVPEALTATQATALLNVFGPDAGSGGVKGLAPATVAGDATKFLRGDGTWAAPSAGITGSDTHVLFFDGANNPAGDAGLTFNKTTGILRVVGGLTLSTNVMLVPDAANALALRNGTVAQTFRVYNTWTDASNYERGVLDWATTANTLTIGPQAAGTGTLRSIAFTSHTIWTTDNTYDIGASGATRPRNVYVAGVGTFGNGIISGTWVEGGSSGSYYLTNKMALSASADGVVAVTSYNGSAFGSLLLGPSGTTFNRIKHNAAGVLELRLADDSAQATWDALAYRVAGTKVVGAQGAAVGDASGGAFIDAEARTALNALLARVRTHGLIAT